MSTNYAKGVPCELQGGHVWLDPIKSEDVLFNPIKLVVCKNCGKVRSYDEPEDSA